MQQIHMDMKSVLNPVKLCDVEKVSKTDYN